MSTVSTHDIRREEGVITAITASAPAIPIPRPSFDSGVAAHFARATRLALVLVDATGTIRFVNPAAAQLFGYLLEDMVGQRVASSTR